MRRVKGIERQVTLQASASSSYKLRVAARIAFLLSLHLALAACVESRLDKQLRQNALEQRVALKRLMAQAESDEQAPITWSRAHRKMLNENLLLKRSQEQLEKARELKSKQWLDLIPDVGAYVNIGANISELGSLNGEDINARLATNLRIPNPFLFYGRLYASALQRQNAEWSHELDRRRLYAQLFEAFVEAKTIDEMERETRARSKGISLLGSNDVTEALDRIEREKDMLQRRKAYHRIKVNQLFNTPGSNWKLEGSLPRISYRNRVDSLKLGGDYGRLAVNLEAIQIESAILRVKRIKFQQWPMLNLGLSLPPLYAKNEDTDFSTDRMLLFSSATKAIDLQDVAGLEDISDAKKRLQLTRERLMQSREREVLRLNQLVNRYRQLLKREVRIKRKIARIGDYGFTEPGAVLNNLAERSSLKLELIEVQRQLGQLDLQFLIWDENYWKS